MKTNGTTSRIFGAANTINHCRLELDTHADTIIFGQSFILLSETGRKCDVSPYTDEDEAIKNVPIVLAETAWKSLELAEIFIIILHEGLWMNTTMDHMSVNPNQLQHFSVTVKDNPNSNSPLCIEYPDRDFVLPLKVKGTKVLVHTRMPTGKDLAMCRHIVLSSQNEWNPHSVKFPKALQSVEE